MNIQLGHYIREIWNKKELLLLALMLVVLGSIFLVRSDLESLFRGGASDRSRWVSKDNGAPLPQYEGRPLKEFHPVAEEVKLFTPEQMNILKQKIENAAGSINVIPDNLIPWIDLGIYKKVIGDFEGARDAWEYASVIRPENSISFKNLGELYWHYLPDYPRAEKNLRTAIANDPEFFDAYITLSDIYRYSYLEKEDLADDVLLEGLSKAPREERNFVAYIARYYKETNDIPKAIEYYERLYRLEPGNPDVAEELRKLRAR